MKRPNSFGIYGMAEEIGEWCWDWFDHEKKQSDYQGPLVGDSKVIRGGKTDFAPIYERQYMRPNRLGAGLRLARSMASA